MSSPRSPARRLLRLARMPGARRPSPRRVASVRAVWFVCAALAARSGVGGCGFLPRRRDRAGRSVIATVFCLLNKTRFLYNCRARQLKIFSRPSLFRSPFSGAGKNYKTLWVLYNRGFCCSAVGLGFRRRAPVPRSGCASLFGCFRACCRVPSPAVLPDRHPLSYSRSVRQRAHRSQERRLSVSECTTPEPPCQGLIERASRP